MIFHRIKFIVLGLLVSCTSNHKDKERTAHNRFRIGVSLLAKNQKSKALEQLLLAHKTNPSDTLILNHLGMAYYFLKEYEHSIVTLKQALQLKPDYSEVHNNLGRVYIEIQDFQKAREHLLKASLDLTYPHKDKVWLNLGLSYFFEQRYQKSEEYFKKALQANNQNCLVHNYYGRSQMELGKFRKAASTFNKAIHSCQKNKAFGEPYYYGALCIFRLGNASKAIAYLSAGRKHSSKPMQGKMDKILDQMRISRKK